jgi:hypothetical protein
VLVQVGVAFLGGALGVVAATPASPVLWVELAPDLECPPPASVVPALAARLGADHVMSGSAPAGALKLRVAAHAPRGATLVLEQDDTVIVERTIDVASNECAGLAQTLALVTEAWLPASTTSAEVVGVPASESPSGSPPSTVKPAIPSRTTPPAAPKRPSENAAAIAPVSAARPRPTAPINVRERHFSVEAAFGAAIALGGASTTATARLGVEGALGRWLAGLRGHLETSGNLDATSGVVSMHHTPADAYLGCNLLPGARADVTLLLAFGVDAASARISGYTRSRTTNFIDPTTGIGLRGRWWTFDDVALLGAGDVVYTFRRESFLDDQLEPVAKSPHARVRLMVGAAWSPF